MKLLDLFCGAGGAGEGYRRAGFDVTGVDLVEPSSYPAGEFIRGDALEVLADLDFLRSFDVVHASPPCQAHTTMSARWRGRGGRADEHVDLIPPTLAALRSSGREWVLENVIGARPGLPGGVVLAGGMFGLGVDRPRIFVLSRSIAAPPRRRVTNPVGVYGARADGRLLWTRSDGSVQRAAQSLAEGQSAMGIDWMDWDALTEAIPPAYTEWIGRQLLEQAVLL